MTVTVTYIPLCPSCGARMTPVYTVDPSPEVIPRVVVSRHQEFYCWWCPMADVPVILDNLAVDSPPKTR